MLRTCVHALALVLVCLLVMLQAPTANSALGDGGTFVVDTTVDEISDPGSGTGCSLREAIYAANVNASFAGCTRFANLLVYNLVLLPSGTYTLTWAGANEDYDFQGDLDIRRAMVISATGTTSPTVTGNETWTDRIFHVLTRTVTIKGLRIRGGWVFDDNGGAVRVEPNAALKLNDSEVADSVAVTSVYISPFGGGGIYNDGGTLTLNNVSLSGNQTRGQSAAGGGLYSSSGSVMLTNVTVNNNTSNYYGGGIANAGTMALSDVTLSHNTAAGGGGILNGGTLTLTQATLLANVATGEGGGLYNGGDARLSDVTLNGNTAIYGGGIYGYRDTSLTNLTLSANSAISNGGGIFFDGTAFMKHMNLMNVTLYGNAAGNGGGIYAGFGLALTNTIVANSPTGGNCSGISGGLLNLSSDNSCGFGVQRDNRNVMLGPLANNGGPTVTHLPFAGSPAIDAGTNSGCPATDQRGKPRPMNGVCDAGAVERQSNDVLYLFLPLIRR